MNYTDDEMAEIVWGDHEGFMTVVPKEYLDTSRWSVYCKVIVKELATGKFFGIWFSEPATEQQDCEPNYDMEEVFPKEVTTTIYVRGK
jgi:hypothetical protein